MKNFLYVIAIINLAICGYFALIALALVYDGTIDQKITAVLGAMHLTTSYFLIATTALGLGGVIGALEKKP